VTPPAVEWTANPATIHVGRCGRRWWKLLSEKSPATSGPGVLKVGANTVNQNMYCATRFARCLQNGLAARPCGAQLRLVSNLPKGL
jgi:hypothetical protein